MYIAVAMQTLSADCSNGPISNLARLCEVRFAESLEFMLRNGKKEQANSLQILQARFRHWTRSLNVCTAKGPNLDCRLEDNKKSRDMLLQALQMLNRRLLHTQAKNNDTESEDSSDNDSDTRETRLSGVKFLLDKLGRLAIYIRLAPTSALDSRVCVFGSRNEYDVSKYRNMATASINGLYPKSSTRVRQHLIRSLTHQCTRLLYLEFHGKERRGQRPSHERINEAPTHTRLETLQQKLYEDEDGIRMQPKRLASTGTKHDGSQDRPCPLCQSTVPGGLFADSESWRNHVNSHLLPFVCISDGCPDKTILRTKSDWVSHICREHGSIGSLCHHAAVDSVSDSDQHGVEAMKTVNKGPMLCPICLCQPQVEDCSSPVSTSPGLAFPTVTGFDQQKHANDMMLHHVSNHLQYLAVLATYLVADQVRFTAGDLCLISKAIVSEGKPIDVMSDAGTSIDARTNYSNLYAGGNEDPQPVSLSQQEIDIAHTYSELTSPTSSFSTDSGYTSSVSMFSEVSFEAKEMCRKGVSTTTPEQNGIINSRRQGKNKQFKKMKNVKDPLEIGAILKRKGIYSSPYHPEGPHTVILPDTIEDLRPYWRSVRRRLEAD